VEVMEHLQADREKQVENSRVKADRHLQRMAALLSQMEEQHFQIDLHQTRQDIITRRKSALENELRQHISPPLTASPSPSLAWTGKTLTKTFSCGLALDSQRAWVVTAIFPEVAGLVKLVATLNKTNDLSGFVVTLRDRFLSNV